jgi:7-cyano-7-deazaguanine synthase
MLKANQKIKKALLLLSSGLDSSANLALAHKYKDFKIVLSLTINYGQKSALKEANHAKKISKFYNVKNIYYDFSSFSKLVQKNSSLLTGKDIPSPKNLDNESETKKTAKKVWVPNRNLVLISIAAAVAESQNLDAIVVGFNKEEAKTFPDNSNAFIKKVNESLAYSTLNHVQVLSHTIKLNKTEIVKEISKLNFPFELVWSCYHNNKFHCGECESCKRFKRALINGLDFKTSSSLMKKIFNS